MLKDELKALDNACQQAFHLAYWEPGIPEDARKKCAEAYWLLSKECSIKRFEVTKAKTELGI